MTEKYISPGKLESLKSKVLAFLYNHWSFVKHIDNTSSPNTLDQFDHGYYIPVYTAGKNTEYFI